jgi:hypothetical protein
MAEEARVGISFDIRGVIHRACGSCGGITNPSVRPTRRERVAWHVKRLTLQRPPALPDMCKCGAPPDTVPVMLHFTPPG